MLSRSPLSPSWGSALGALCYELRKTARKGYAWLGVGLCAALPVATALVFRFGACSGTVTADRPVTAYVPLMLSMVVSAGLLAPLFASLACVDLVAGELRTGALNLLLTRPIPRVTLILIRYVAAMALAGGLLATTTFSALVAGYVTFSRHAILCPDGTSISGTHALVRAAGAWVVATVAAAPIVGMTCVVASLGLPVLSTLALSGVTLVVACSLSRLPALAAVSFVRYVDAWHLMFTPRPSVAAIASAFGVPLAYAALSVVASTFVLSRRDMKA